MIRYGVRDSRTVEMLFPLYLRVISSYLTIDLIAIYTLTKPQNNHLKQSLTASTEHFFIRDANQDANFHGSIVFQAANIIKTNNERNIISAAVWVPLTN